MTWFNRKAAKQSSDIARFRETVKLLKDSRFAAATEEHARDMESFRSAVVRRGEFLDIWTRRGNTHIRDSFLISTIQRVTWTPGRPPDFGGSVVKYENSNEVVFGECKRSSIWYDLYVSEKTRVGYTGQKSCGYFDFEEFQRAEARVCDFPRYAQDDMVALHGPDILLLTPYNCGLTLYEQFMTALELQS